MKKIISVLLCIAMLISMAIVPASAETYGKNWEFEGGVDGWFAQNSTLTSVGGNLVQTITTAKSNTFLLSPGNLGIDASVYKYLKVRVKNSTAANGFFRFEAMDTTESKFAGVWTNINGNSNPADGQWHEYCIDLSSLGTDWSGTISQFRLCMSTWNTEGTIEYDYIRVSDTADVEDEEEEEEVGEERAVGWDFDGSVLGFGANSSTLTSVGGNLVQTITTAKNNTWLLSPNNLGIDASIYKYLKVRVKNSTTAPGFFRFQATGTNKSAFTSDWVAIEDNVTPNDGEWHEYIVDLSKYGTEWSGTISRFRLCMSAWNCDGTVEFDYIKFSNVGAPKEYSYAVAINSLNAVSDKALNAPVELTSAVEGADEAVVEYFANGKSIGTANQAPYTVAWTPDATGGYHINAVATIDGTKVTSDKVYVNVYDPSVIEKSAYYWKFNSATQGWGGNNSTVSVNDGCLVQSVEANKNNSFLLSPSGLGIDASVYKYVKIRVAAEYTVPGQLAVQWTTSEDTAWDTSWGEGAKTKLIGTTAVTNDGEFHDYIIDLSQHAGWKDSITRLRVKVTPWSNSTAMKARVDYIRVSDTAENGIDESDVPKPTTSVSFVCNTELDSLTVYNGAKYTDEVITGTPDGKYALSAGLYTYTAVAKATGYSKLHKNFIITDADVENGNKVINIELPEWENPGYWQIKTIFNPTDEMSNNLFPDPAPEIVIDTPGFKEGSRTNGFTTQAELEEFVADADEACDNMWTTVIGTSDNDLNIYLAIFSKGAEGNANWETLEDAAAALHKLDKPIVWVSGQVHGNETSGGESTLALINELSGEWGDEMLDKVSVVVLPRQNPKGSMFSRRTPNSSNDINRDRIKLELQETHALNNAYWLIQPEVALDAHEYGAVAELYNGKYTYAAHDLLFSASTNKQLSEDLRAMSHTLYEDAVHETLAGYGLRSMEYYDGKLSSSMTEQSGRVHNNTGANALLPSFSFLAEALVPGAGYNSKLHYDRRVKSHLITQKTVIEVTANNADEVKEFIASEREALLDTAGVYNEDDIIVIDQSKKEELIDFEYVDLLNTTIETSKVKWYSHTNGEITKSVTRPTAYIIPKTEKMATAIERLKLIGVEMEEIAAGTVISEGLQKYVVTSSKVATSLDQGVYQNTLTANITESEAVTFADGAYIIPMKQVRTGLIGVALEPERVESFVTFRVIDVADVAVGEELPYYRYTLDYPTEDKPEIEVAQGEDKTVVSVNIAKPENGTLIAVIYDGSGRCVGVKTVEGGKAEFAKTTSGTVKVLIWKSVNAMEPIADAIVKEIK